MKNITCWEYKKCGRQREGERAHELGVCPAALAPDTYCWLVAGTMCSGEIEGTFALKYEDCIICDYYNKMQEYLAKRPRIGFFLFGQYLCRQGLATNEQVIQARSLQLRHNQKIGVLAKRNGILTDEQIQRILIIQEETLKKFGELSVELGYLSKAQVKELLLEQEDNYLFFGEALVKLGVLTEKEMFAQLKAFNTLKIQKQHEQEKRKKHLDKKPL
jgi:hypothetical protein